MTIDTKRCTKCGEHKPRAEFNKCSASRDQLQGICRKCHALHSRQWFETHRAEHQEHQRRWRTRHPDANRAQVRNWRTANPDKNNVRVSRGRARKRAALDTAADHEAIAELRREAALAAAFMGAPFAVDHVIPLARGGKHHHDNLRVLPARLNSVKGAKFDSEVQSPEFHAWLDPRPTFEQVSWVTYRPARAQ